MAIRPTLPFDLLALRGAPRRPARRRWARRLRGIDPFQYFVLVPAQAPGVGQLERTGDEVLVLLVGRECANRRWGLADQLGEVLNEEDADRSCALFVSNDGAPGEGLR